MLWFLLLTALCELTHQGCGYKYSTDSARAPLLQSVSQLLGHVDEALEGGGDPGPLPLHEHHASVYVHRDAAKRVQLLALVPPAH